MIHIDDNQSLVILYMETFLVCKLNAKYNQIMNKI